MVTLFRQRRGGAERFGVDDWLAWVSFAGNSYPLGVNFTLPGSTTEAIETNFEAYTQRIYKTNGPIFACIYARMRLFSQVRFQFQTLAGQGEGNTFGNPDLAPLERPWTNGTTADLLARAEQDVSLGGNSYTLLEPGRKLRRLRPDWTNIVLSAPPDEALASDVVGYLYLPGGPRSHTDPVVFRPEQVAHWAPIPDPTAQYRGMSWLSPVLDEVLSDSSATHHKQKFFDNAATPNLAVSFKEAIDEEKFKRFMTILKEGQGGIENAYKTLYLGGGADVKVVGADLRQISFKDVQGAGETRMCAAAGVPPVIVGLSEGLQAATYSNYGLARREFGDHWARPQWGSVCAAYEPLVVVPGGSRLWYADKQIAMLREDAKDAAEIQSTMATTIKNLTDAGFEADAAISAVMAGDLGRLTGKHTGLFSVQLQPPVDPNAVPAAPPADPTSAVPPPEAKSVTVYSVAQLLELTAAGWTVVANDRR